MKSILIIGFKGTGRRAVPVQIYFGNSAAEALQAARDRCQENWSSMVRVKNPTGRKVPFRTMRGESWNRPETPGLFLPPAPDPAAAPDHATAGPSEAGDVETILAQSTIPRPRDETLKPATHRRQPPTRKPR